MSSHSVPTLSRQGSAGREQSVWDRGGNAETEDDADMEFMQEGNQFDALGNRLERGLGKKLDVIAEFLTRIEEQLGQQRQGGAPLAMGSLKRAKPEFSVPVQETLSAALPGEIPEIALWDGASEQGALRRSGRAATSMSGTPGSICMSEMSQSLGEKNGITSPVATGARGTMGRAASPSQFCDDRPEASPLAAAFVVRFQFQDSGFEEGGELLGLRPTRDGLLALDDFEAWEKEKAETEKPKAWFVISPSARGRLAWDILGAFFIIYDMILIPFTLSFEVDDESERFTYMWWSSLIVLLFWSCDLVASFFTGYFKKGEEELRMKYIAWNYVKSWFLLDLLLVSSDWVCLVMSSPSGQLMVRMGRTLRILRVLRSMRLLRLAKLRRIMEQVQDNITSEFFHITLGVTKLIFMVIALNHWIACGWWAVGKATPHGTETWIRGPVFDYDAYGLDFSYLTALHWSLTQFTPASMEVVPRNTYERLFSVIVLLFALIVFSSFVSSITAAMTQLRQLHTVFDKNFSILRRYLRERSIPAALTVRIMRYAEHQVEVRAKVMQEADVKLLQVLSQPLKMELVHSTYEPKLNRHPLFRELGTADTDAMQAICTTVCMRMNLSSGDTLFTESMNDDRMFFVMMGKLRYHAKNPTGKKVKGPKTFQVMSGMGTVKYQKNTASHYRAISDNSLHEGEWCCEPALFVNGWTHFGTMRSSTITEVLSLDAKEFIKVSVLYRRVSRGISRYARAFVEKLNVQASERTLSDMPVNVTSSEELEYLAQDAFEVHREFDEESRHSSSEEEEVTPVKIVKHTWKAVKKIRPLVKLGLTAERFHAQHGHADSTVQPEGSGEGDAVHHASNLS